VPPKIIKNISTFASKLKVKMKKSFQLFRLLRFYPLSCLFIAAIWIACFMNIPETPLDNVAFMDKWTHLVMYGSTCAIIFIENRRHDIKSKGRDIEKPGHDKPKSMRRLLFYSWLLPVLMSGLIEILQATCTGGRRSGDWLDFAANTTGATIGVVTGILLAKCLATCRRG